MKIKCAHCGKTSDKPVGAVNRAKAAGLRLFCNRRCSGLGRRKHKTKAQRRLEKKLYDAAYRIKNLVLLKAKKRAYFQRTYDPEKARIERKKRMPYHIEYCRQPAYKAKKKIYDVKRRASEFGAFAEAYRLTIDLNREIKGRMSNEEIRIQNGTWSKPQQRRRAVKAPERTRRRHRDRRDRHTAPVGQ